MQIITSIIAGIAGGIAGVAFSSLSTRLRAHRQEESSVLLLSVEVVQNLAASTAMNKQVRDPQRTDWDPKEADPGSFKHAVWDAELPHIINALAHNPQTFAAVMNAYMTLSAEPRMRLPEGQTHGAQRYQWGGWITPQIEYMHIAFEDADKALRETHNQLSKRSWLNRIRESS